MALVEATRIISLNRSVFRGQGYTQEVGDPMLESEVKGQRLPSHFAHPVSPAW